jgi:tellurite resistance protein
MTQTARDQLAELVHRIFADGVVEPAERDELHRLYREGGLTVKEVREVFGQFVSETWGEVIADGTVSPEEKLKMATILRELRLPADLLPAQMRVVLGL